MANDRAFIIKAEKPGEVFGFHTVELGRVWVWDRTPSGTPAKIAGSVAFMARVGCEKGDDAGNAVMVRIVAKFNELAAKVVDELLAEQAAKGEANGKAK